METYRRYGCRIRLRSDSLSTSQVSRGSGTDQACKLNVNRGPHEERWFGWRGGWELLKRPQMTDLSPEALTEGPLRHKHSTGNEMNHVRPATERADVEALAAGAGARAGTATTPPS